MSNSLDGSSALAYGVVETFECGVHQRCHKENAGDINVPQFFKINFKEKTIRGTLESGAAKTSSFEAMERIDRKLFPKKHNLEHSRGRGGACCFLRLYDAIGEFKVSRS